MAGPTPDSRASRLFNWIVGHVSRKRKVAEISLGVAVGIFSSFTGLFFGSDIGNILRTLWQTQASMLAIIVPLGLISVSITSNQYTPLVSKIFHKFHFLKKAIVLYGLSILIAFFGSIMVSDLPQNTGWAQMLILGLSTYTATMNFIYLFYIVEKTFDYLDPSYILSHLENRTSVTRFEQSITTHSGNDLSRSKSSSVHLMYLMGIGAYNNHDFYTAEKVIESFSTSSKTLLKEFSNSPAEERQKVNNFDSLFRDWTHLGEIAITEGTVDEYSVIVNEMCSVTKCAIRNGLTSCSKKSIETLSRICTIGIQDGKIQKSHCEALGEGLELCLNQDRPYISIHFVRFIYDVLESISQNSEMDSNQMLEKELLEQIITGWHLFVKHHGDSVGNQSTINIGTIRPALQATNRIGTASSTKSEKYDDLHFEFGDRAVKYFKAVDAPENPDSWFTRVANQGVRYAHRTIVADVIVLLIDMYLTNQGDSQIWGSRIAETMSKGGEQGVNEAFTHVLSNDHLDEDERDEITKLYDEAESTYQKMQRR